MSTDFSPSSGTQQASLPTSMFEVATPSTVSALGIRAFGVAPGAQTGRSEATATASTTTFATPATVRYCFNSFMIFLTTFTKHLTIGMASFNGFYAASSIGPRAVARALAGPHDGATLHQSTLDGRS